MELCASTSACCEGFGCSTSDSADVGSVTTPYASFQASIEWIIRWVWVWGSGSDSCFGSTPTYFYFFDFACTCYDDPFKYYSYDCYD